jgi:hypothetical protein
MLLQAHDIKALKGTSWSACERLKRHLHAMTHPQRVGVRGEANGNERLSGRKDQTARFYPHHR